MQLSESQTDAFIAACRLNGVTVHTALTAALVIAGRRLSAGWRTLPVRVFTPTNIRARLIAGDAYHDCVSGASTLMSPTAAASVWQTARQARSDLAAFISPTGYFVVDQLLGDHSPDAETAIGFTTAALGIDLVLTNPGRVHFDLPPDAPIRVVGLHGPCVLFGFEDEQTVAAVTYDGRLSLTHFSFSPIDGLLATATSLLDEAIAHTAAAVDK